MKTHFTTKVIHRSIGSMGLLLAALLLTGCPAQNTTPTDSFDRTAMLTQVADGTIMPSYDALWTSTADLTATVATFTSAPSQQSLAASKEAWLAVADAWQDARPFDFGPAEGLFGNLAENIGTYPASAEKIEAFVAAGDTSLSGFDRDARGIYGVEFLLFAENDDAVVTAFQDPLRCAYLRAVVSGMHAEITQVREAWMTGYRTEFISRNGTEPGSGTSLLFNNMVRSYEQLKNYALGLPLGRVAGQTQAEPEKVEGLYSNRSTALAKRHYASVMRIWQGESLEKTPILGFRQYLNAVPNGDRLMLSTLEQDVEVSRAFGQIHEAEPLHVLITSDPARVETLHTECQKLTRFLKSDLSSLLGLAITFSSGDGD